MRDSSKGGVEIFDIYHKPEFKGKAQVQELGKGLSSRSAGVALHTGILLNMIVFRSAIAAEQERTHSGDNANHGAGSYATR